MKKKNLFLKSTSSLLAMLFVVMSAFMFTACDPDEEDPEPEAENSILEIVAESENHTQLEAFVNDDDDLAAALGGDNLTLFAPNDAAFDKLKVILDVESLDQIKPEIIASVLRFHAAASVELRESFNENTEIQTLQGENISFNAESNIATGGSNDNVEFVGDEILATNGVVHVVGTILVPPSIFQAIEANLGKVSQTILLGADFSILAEAVAKADTYAEAEGTALLTEVLAGEDNITVFAPINQVFETAGITLETFTAEQWYGIILNHVVSGDLSAEAIGGGLAQGENTLTTFAQANVQVAPTVFQENETLAIGGAPVVSPDITSENGRVHAVAGIVSSVNTYTTVLLGGQGNAEEGFYGAINNMKYGYGAARDNSASVDLAYYFGNTNEATIAAIDDGGLNAVYTAVELPIEGIFETRNSTRFRVTDLAPEQFGGILLNSQLETAASSENNTNSSATNLQEGSVVAFTLDAARGAYVGLIRVVEIDDTNGEGTITIEVKVQVEGN
ncbi:MAG: fasciclin domain-containing protein [Bacteroidota bacterium]